MKIEISRQEKEAKLSSLRNEIETLASSYKAQTVEISNKKKELENLIEVSKTSYAEIEVKTKRAKRISAMLAFESKRQILKLAGLDATSTFSEVVKSDLPNRAKKKKQAKKQ